MDDTGNEVGSDDRAPFGESIAVTGVRSRKGFIDKESDRETRLSNHGVRAYCSESGQFTSIDPLWEKYPSVSPYQYGLNSPVSLVDRDGREVVTITGSDPDRATQELDGSSHLSLTRDPSSGRLSASGVAYSDADKMLLDAIEDNDITVEEVLYM